MMSGCWLGYVFSLERTVELLVAFLRRHVIVSEGLLFGRRRNYLVW
jgi:hypothetical protein